MKSWQGESGRDYRQCKGPGAGVACKDQVRRAGEGRGES